MESVCVNTGTPGAFFFLFLKKLSNLYFLWDIFLSYYSVLVRLLGSRKMGFTLLTCQQQQQGVGHISSKINSIEVISIINVCLDASKDILVAIFLQLLEYLDLIRPDNNKTSGIKRTVLMYFRKTG